jgi:uncharacterized membrane protein (Fun14 family)
MMENLIDTTFSNPVYLAIAGVLAIMLAYAIIKKIIKMVFMVGLMLVLYLLYLNYTGQNVPGDLDALKKSVSDGVGKVKEAASESINDAKQSTKKIVEDKVEDRVEEFFGK